MPYKKILLFAWVIALPACASAPSAQDNTQTVTHLISPYSPAGSSITHTVAKGETLWRISRIYQIDLDDLITANRIPDSSSISAGQVLVIPKSQAQKIPKKNFSAKNDFSDFVWPVQGGEVVTHFHQKIKGVANKGIKIVTRQNQNIVASRDGQIIFIGSLPGYGDTIIIDHKDGLSSVYCGHTATNVQLGEEVKQGMVLAKTAESPRQNGESLHFEIRKKNKPQNPLFYLN